MTDTSAKAEQILIEGYRAMPAWKKLAQVASLTQAVQQMALSRLKKQYPGITQQEQRLRLASLWLPRDAMIRYCNWDPQEHGY